MIDIIRPNFMPTRRTLLLGGVAGPIVFGIVVFSAATLRPDYRHVSNTISELGADGTPYARLMNFGGFIPAGALIAAFGIALSSSLPRTRHTAVVSVLVTLFGCLIATAGMISCDPGCPQTGGSLEQVVHDAIGPLMTLCIAAAAAVFSASGLPGWRRLAVYSLVTSTLAPVLLVMLVRSLDTRAMTGLYQRLLLTVLFSWCGVMAVAARSSSRS